MYKVVLIPTRLFNDSVDYALCYNITKDLDNVEEVDGWWLTCELPAIPHKDDMIDVGSIGEENIYEQLKPLLPKSEILRRAVRKFRNEQVDNKDMLLKDVLPLFCGISNYYDNLCAGYWYVERCSFIPNDERIFIDIRHEL